MASEWNRAVCILSIGNVHRELCLTPKEANITKILIMKYAGVHKIQCGYTTVSQATSHGDRASRLNHME